MLCGISAGFLSRLPKSGKWLVTLKKGFALLVLLGASLLLVYAGQATDFPDLTELLAKSEPKIEANFPADGESPGDSLYGGDEFLE